ncbi:MAG: type I-C CRISPR-associated protein Cas8c/Csd1 [Eubacteriales bacterium]|nr:type I-C CRISPR-associated protein Cas8c/Csd1 [Eubacteriales bacterium]
MILQALTDYYRALAESGQIDPPGWGQAKVSFALYLRTDGALERVMPLQTEQQRGKKTVLAPQLMRLPAPVKRTVGIAANFLFDHSGYLLGVDNKGKPQRTAQCFAACKALHEQLLTGIDAPAAKAVLAFFRTWQPDQAATHPALAEHWDAIIAGGNLIFRCADGYAHDDPAIRAAWDRHYSSAPTEDGAQTICLVTGEPCAAEAVHPAIRGVPGAQSSGAALVSFNAPAFCSYGKEQSYNAPTSKYAAFAYTTALNHLLADRAHTFAAGDATVVFWAHSGEAGYQDFFSSMLNDVYEERDLGQMVQELLRGHPVVFDQTMLDPAMDFYILGLSPNAARLSVRSFLRNSFGSFLEHIQAHRERLRIVRPAYERFEVPSLKAILDATVDLNSRDKQASPQLAGELLRAILNDTPYPATLLNGVVLRIRAEQRDKNDPKKPFKVTWPRAAILKAYFLKNHEHSPHYQTLLEVAQMDLNDTCTYLPYLLGRLFSTMEKIQLASADWKLSQTIKDSYFNSAAVTPKIIFHKLFPLNEYHMKKLMRDKPGLAVTLGREKAAIIGKITRPIPSRFNAEEANCFYLGYYHQDMLKKEDK